MADVYVGRVRSARSRLRPKGLSESIQDNLAELRDMGGGDEGLMQGATNIPPPGEEIEIEDDPRIERQAQRRAGAGSTQAHPQMPYGGPPIGTSRNRY